MDNGLIGKIEKSKRYAQERDRIKFESLNVSFSGENGNHTVSFDGHHWHCDCDFFHTRGMCAHTMALERVLENMVPPISATDA